jgi:ABC-type amino acid transport substrate-binding protein
MVRLEFRQRPLTAGAIGGAWPAAVCRSLLLPILLLPLLLGLGGSAAALAAPAPLAIAVPAPQATLPGERRLFPGNAPSRPNAPPPAAALAAMPPDIERILQRGQLVVAVLGQDNAPFFVQRQGQLSGLDIQLAQALADQLGVELEVVRSPQTFDQVVDTVYAQKADLAISKISRTLKRAQRVRFSRPYLRMRQGLLVNRLQLAQQSQGRTMIETIRDLRGEVGVIQGSSYVGFLQQKFPQATIVEYPTWEEIVEAVVQGELLAAYRDELEIKKVVRTRPDAALQLQTIALTDTQDSLAAVLPWGSTHLLAFVDQYLDTLTTQYTVDTVLDEYAQYWNPVQPPRS